MKGLILKDFFNLKKSGRSIVFILAFYVLYAFMMDSTSFITGMIVLLCTMLAITSFSYDDLAKWDKYALSLPITRKDMILSKYILAFILSVLGVVIAFAASMIVSKLKTPVAIEDLLLASYVVFAIALIFISILLPLIYKFGVEKSRLFIMLVFGVPAALFFLLASLPLGLQLPTESQLMLLLKISPVIIIILQFISFTISLNIFKNKDL